MTPPPSRLANAPGSQRQEMVAASTSCQISPTRCQARTRLYRDGRLELAGFPVADISEYLADESVTISARRSPRRRRSCTTGSRPLTFPPASKTSRNWSAERRRQ